MARTCSHPSSLWSGYRIDATRSLCVPWNSYEPSGMLWGHLQNQKHFWHQDVTNDTSHADSGISHGGSSCCTSITNFQSLLTKPEDEDKFRTNEVGKVKFALFYPAGCVGFNNSQCVAHLEPPTFSKSFTKVLMQKGTSTRASAFQMLAHTAT